jgi:hypothetical protein
VSRASKIEVFDTVEAEIFDAVVLAINIIAVLLRASKTSGSGL